MEDESFLDDPLNGVDGWNRTLELSEFNNKVENTFLGNVNNVLEYGENRDTKVDIVHDPLLLTDDIKTELPELIECVDNNDLENICEIKEEPSEVDLTNNKAEKDGYLEDNDVILHKEIVYVNCMKPDEVVEVTSTDLHKLTTGIKYSHCETCNEVYTWFCLKCPMLSFILDKSTMDRLENRATKTIPNFLIIKNSPSAGHVCIYALKNIPQFVKFGPFEGLDPIQTTSGCAWKLKNGKLYMSPDSAKRSNWMQYVNCAKLISEQNLTIFQYGGNLFFRTSREINAGDELLVYYGEVNSAGSGDAQSYCYPVVDNQMENIYACTFCCLGFSAEVYLHKHNSICPNRDNKVLYKEIVQCAFCKIYLDSGENSNHHMKFCCVKYTWSSSTTKEASHDLTSACNDGIANTKHNSKNPVTKSYRCDICKSQYKHRNNLNRHLKEKHSIVEIIRFKCSECSYETTTPESFQRHANVHEKKKKSFICDLNLEIREKEIPQGNQNQGRIINVKNDKQKESNQENADDNSKPLPKEQQLNCEICSENFDDKASLEQHMREKHVETNVANSSQRNGIEKKFKCPQCVFQTNFQMLLDKHIAQHKKIKQFECGVCGRQFGKQYHVKKHIQTAHTDNNGHKCPKCDYTSKYEKNLERHMLIHENVKPFECKVCKSTFKQRQYLKMHVKNTHKINAWTKFM